MKKIFTSIFLISFIVSFVNAEEMKQMLREIKKDHIIIFSTHILELALDLCDEIVILNKGITPYCLNCGERLKFKLIRESIEELEKKKHHKNSYFV